MKVTKVNIDKLIDVLMTIRQEAEYVDMEIFPENILKIYVVDKTNEEGEPDINQSAI